MLYLPSDIYIEGISDSCIPTPDILQKLRDAVANVIEIDAAAQGVMATLFLVSNLLYDYISNTSQSASSGLHIEVKSVGLPIGAGLGSSAAFSVALSSALIRFKALLTPTTTPSPTTTLATNLVTSSWQYSLNKSSDIPVDIPYLIPTTPDLTGINKWAYAAEVVIHGTPSGLDNTTSCYGGALKFSKKSGSGFELLQHLPSINILLTNTHVPRRTSDLVAKVGIYYKKYPSIVQPLFDSIEEISQKFLTLAKR